MRFEKVRVGQKVVMKASKREEIKKAWVMFSDKPCEIIGVDVADRLDVHISSGGGHTFWVNAEWLELVG